MNEMIQNHNLMQEEMHAYNNNFLHSKLKIFLLVTDEEIQTYIFSREEEHEISSCM